MTRSILFLAALLLALPAIAADDNKGRGKEKKALQANCERQANQQNLIGKERKKFVKDCTKDGKHAKRRSEGRDQRATPAQPATQAATPTAPSTGPSQPAPTPAAQPATPAAPPTATTAPAPTPAAQPATTAAAPPPANPVPTAEQKRAQCADEAKRSGVSIPARKQYIDKCMAR